MSYGKVHEGYWDSERLEPVSDAAALLGLFLLTGEHRNAIGCFKLGTGAILDNPRFGKWGIEGVSFALSELVECGFIVRDDRTGWTFITNGLRKDPIKGAKAAIHALGLLTKVPKNTQVYQALVEALLPQLKAEEKALTGKDGWPIDTPSHTPSNGDAIPKPSPEPSPLPQPQPEPEKGRTRASWLSGIDLSKEPVDEPAEQVVADFDEIREEVFGAAQARLRRDGMDLIHARKWLDQGATQPIWRAVFRAQQIRRRSAGQRPIDTLAYFEQPIADALAVARRPMPEGNVTTLHSRAAPAGNGFHQMAQSMFAEDQS